MLLQIKARCTRGQCRNRRIPLCLCGEGAAQPALAEAYARLGVRAFSLPARELLEVKEYLMGVTL